jgi:hypothetical protein
MRTEIVQVVPELAPSVGGVADYALLLAQALRDEHDVRSIFLVGDPGWNGASALDGFSVERIDDRNDHELFHRLAKLGATTVLLHYVGYGYQPRGCPSWLVSGLQSWKNAHRRRRLTTMFHELFAAGLPWQSSFWTAPLQKNLARSLALLSDYGLTNLTSSRKTLAGMTDRAETDFTVLPVFSTVGEPRACADRPSRRARMIVFGSAEWRRQAYQDQGAALELACHMLGIDTIVDIGERLTELPELSVRRVEMGTLPSAEASRELAAAYAGYFTYPASYLGKSTIFAAYAAHALVPVTCGRNTAANFDGLRAGEHYLALDAARHYDGTTLTAIAESAQRWYVDHNLRRQTARFAEFLVETHARNIA